MRNDENRVKAQMKGGKDRRRNGSERNLRTAYNIYDK
jgi:hypothetical protein